MSEQSAIARGPPDSRRVVDHGVEVLQLAPVRVRRESFELGEALAIRTYAASGKIERDRVQAALVQRGREQRPRPPPREALEPVTNDDAVLRAGHAIQVSANRASAGDRELELFPQDS